MNDDRPNRLFVFGDPWRARAIGFAGNTQVRTPHLDRLAEQSLHVRHGVASSPACRVWRASMASLLR